MKFQRFSFSLLLQLKSGTKRDSADPKMTLQAICDRLETMRERTPRGRSKWEPSSVKMVLERAKKLGLL